MVDFDTSLTKPPPPEHFWTLPLLKRLARVQTKSLGLDDQKLTVEISFFVDRRLVLLRINSRPNLSLFFCIRVSF